MLAGPSALNCSRCLIPSVSSQFSARQLLTGSLHYTTRRFRSAKGQKKYREAAKERAAAKVGGNAQNSYYLPQTPIRPLILPANDPEKTISFFEKQVSRWSKRQSLHDRLESFGVPRSYIRPLLNKFVSEVEAKNLSTKAAYDYHCLERFAKSSPESDQGDDYCDIVYTSIFYAWASNPQNQAMLEAIVPPSALTAISRLYHAANMEYPGERYIEARRMRRKVIMHVGPTNSGKTHSALRALAAAGSGVYAGPLRLLAHEIWERLNLGQIVPLGVEEEPVKVSPSSADTDSALDATLPPSPETPAPALQGIGNPKYRRPCNMITGEENKIVDENAPLLSCTVEMVSVSRKFEVAVVDEIQMIADSERGFAWTNAVLGLCAKELHLCGEETAVPVIEALLKDTDDELIVHRYERLTPLIMGDSLEGSYKNVQKGDCIVTFSRRSIFGIKRLVEELTGMRCAVVYGGLPPEIRSEQARLFNDPDSDYHVMIGSDAIGMGLNLKIHRIIFEATSKYNGERRRPLSLSQTKQIAGRAGRFGQVKEQVGYVTTLRANEVGFVQKALAKKPPPLLTARLGPDPESCQRVLQALPPNSNIETIYNAHVYVSRTKPFCRYSVVNRLHKMATFIDERMPNLSLEDRVLFMAAPIPWREDSIEPFVSSMMENYNLSYSVTIADCLKNMDYEKVLDMVEMDMSSGKTPYSTPEVLNTLEFFHRMLGLYNWLSFRQPVAFNDAEAVQEMKERVDKALQWCLEGVSELYKEPEPEKESEKAIKYLSTDDLKKMRLAEALEAQEERKKQVPVLA